MFNFKSFSFYPSRQEGSMNGNELQAFIRSSNSQEEFKQLQSFEICLKVIIPSILNFFLIEILATKTGYRRWQF